MRALLRARYASKLESVSTPFRADQVVLIHGGTRGAGAAPGVGFVVLLSPHGGVVTGSVLDRDQQVFGGNG